MRLSSSHSQSPRRRPLALARATTGRATEEPELRRAGYAAMQPSGATIPLGRPLPRVRRGGVDTAGLETLMVWMGALLAAVEAQTTAGNQTLSTPAPDSDTENDRNLELAGRIVGLAIVIACAATCFFFICRIGLQKTPPSRSGGNQVSRV